MNFENNIIPNKKIAIWLFACAFFVFLMVVVGGLTRLTHSGLSIVSWKPIHGIIPPMNALEWQEELKQYTATPEYIKNNYGMGVEEFKDIYWWEYAHRLLGRGIGVVFFVPFLIFNLKGYFSFKEAAQLLGIFALGGLQGFVGWWMVRSGLIDNPAVSHYRLAAHLLIALMIFALLLWKGLKYYLPELKIKAPENQRAKFVADLLIVAVLVQITFGAFLAGLHGGLTYNTWPLMDGKIIPAGMRFYLNNIEFIQFFHRWWAFVVMAVVVCFTLMVKKGKIKYDNEKTNLRLKKGLRMLHMVVGTQIILGVITLINVVPVPLASLHQVMAVIILGNAVYLRRVIN